MNDCDSHRTFLHVTCSVCPTCLMVIPAQIFAHDGKVYMKKFCRQHGHTEVLLSSDEDYYRDALGIGFEPQRPKRYTAVVEKGCPTDCGICPDHQQRCMIGVIEITDHCQIECPICFSINRSSYAMTVAELDRCLDALEHSEGKVLDLLVISGGEPTIHPDFFGLMSHIKDRGFRRISVNTNGIELAKDKSFARHARELGLSFTLWVDGFRSSTHQRLRGRDMREVQTKALEHLGEAGVDTTLLCVVARGINEDEVGAVLDLGMRLPFVRGVTFQPLAFTGQGGRTFPRDPRDVVTVPDIVKLLDDHTDRWLVADDFQPVPAPHPLCETNTYLLMTDDGQPPIPLTRLLARDRYVDLVTNRAVLRPDEKLDERLRTIIDDLFANESHTPTADRALSAFRALHDRCFPPAGPISAVDRDAACASAFKTVFIVPYMDEFNLDLTRLRSCVSMQALPDGRLIPSCSYYPIHRRADPRFAVAARQAQH